MEFMHTHGALQGLIAAHIDSHQTEGVDWPATATHCVVMRTAPVLHDGAIIGDWSEPRMFFFDSEAEMRLWQKYVNADWDTDFTYSCQEYEWDWGPNLRRKYGRIG